MTWQQHLTMAASLIVGAGAAETVQCALWLQENPGQSVKGYVKNGGRAHFILCYGMLTLIGFAYVGGITKEVLPMLGFDTLEIALSVSAPWGVMVGATTSFGCEYMARYFRARFSRKSGATSAPPTTEVS